ncbi:MAG: protein kinase, partial [Nannocystaceae bacterium]|nr:protein kinase [Nannocystaceae bacterium]
YIVMALIKCKSLARTLKRQCTVRSRTAAKMMIALASAVEHAHQAGVLHRDLEPTNILVDADGRPKLIDFGIARALDDETEATLQTRAGHLLGTLAYMSPEQLTQQSSTLDERADVYGLGVVLYELVAGRLPYPQDVAPAQRAALIAAGPTVSATSVAGTADLDLDAIVARALHGDPRGRYVSADALALDLERFVRGDKISASRPSRVRAVWRRAREHRTALAVSAVLVPLAIGATAMSTTPETNAPDTAADGRGQRDLGTATEYAHAILRAQRAFNEGSMGLAKTALRDAAPDQRNWEWHRLSSQVDRSVQVLDPGTGPIRALTWSGEARILLSGDEQGNVRAWTAADSAQGPPVLSAAWSVNAGASVEALVVDEQRRHLLVASEHGVAVWDLATGHAVATIDGVTQARSLAIDPARRRVAVGRYHGALDIVSLADFSSVTRIENLPTAYIVRDIVWSADGRLCACVGSGHQVQQWDVASATVSRTFHGHRDELEALAPSTDGLRIYSAGWDDTIREFDVDGGELVRTLPTNEDGIMDLLQLEPSQLIAATRSDQVVIWDLASGEIVRRLHGHEQSVEAIVGSAAENWLASASLDGTIRTWDLGATGLDEVLVRRANKIHAVHWLRNSDQILVATGPQWGDEPFNEVALVSLQGEALVTRRDHARTVDALAVSHDEQHIASVDRGGALFIRQGESLAPIHRVDAHPGPIVAVAFSPEGQTVATAAANGEIAVWEVATGRELLRQSTGHPIRDMVWSTGLLRVVGDDATLRTWATADGRPNLERAAVSPLPGRTAGTAIEPLGAGVVVGDEDGAVIRLSADGAVMWRTETFGRKITDLALSPDGRRIVASSGDYGVRLLDVESGELLLLIGRHGSEASSVAFSADGGTIVSGGFDRRARLWRARAQSHER